MPLAMISFVAMVVSCAFLHQSQGLRLAGSAIVLIVGWLGIARGWLSVPRLPGLLALLGVLLLALLISSLVSIDPKYSLKTLGRQHLWFLLMVPAVAALFSEPRTQWWGIGALGAAGVLSALPGILLYFRADALHASGWIEKPSDYVWRATDDLGNSYQRARGMLESYTRSALIQVFALPGFVALGLCAERRRNWLLLACSLVAAGICGLFLLLTKSRGAWIAAAMAMVFTFVAMRGRWRWLLLVGVLGFAALLAMPQERARAATMVRQLGQPDLLLSGRLDLWKQGVAPIQSSPLFGIGYGANIFLRPAARERGYALLTDRPQPDLHQMYLQTLAEVGLIGLLAYGVVIGWIGWRGLRTVRNPIAPEKAPATAAAFSLLVTLLIVGVIYTYNEDRIGQLFWIILGLLAAGERRVSESAPPSDP